MDDRASFRRFCGFAAQEPTPEHAAFVRFRAELVRRGLDRSLFEVITRQSDRRGVVVRTGTLVDATLLQSASIHHDDDAMGLAIAGVSWCTATRPILPPTRMLC